MSNRASKSSRKNDPKIEPLESRSYLSVTFDSALATGAPGLILAPNGAVLANVVSGGVEDLITGGTSNTVFNTGVVGVALGDGGGTFGAPTIYPVSSPVVSVATGDVDSTGYPAIVAGTDGSPGYINEFFNDGLGNYTVGAGANGLDNNSFLAVGDFTNDANFDVLTVSNSPTATDNAMLLLGDYNGNLTAQAPFSLPFGNVSAVAVGDFNGDGNLDFVVANQANDSVSVFLGNGNGTFQAPATYSTGPSPTSIAVGDFTGKSQLDIVTADSTGGEISYLANNGNGTFAAPVNTPVSESATNGGPTVVTTANYTGSATSQDLVVSLSSGSTADGVVLLGNGDGTFSDAGTISGTGGTQLLTGNLTGNGQSDVVDVSNSQIYSYINPSTQQNDIPTAAVDSTQATGSPSSSTYNFTVTYTDASATINTATLGDANLTVTFPDDTQQAATLVSTNLPESNTVHATYQISFASDLTIANDGNYTVAINSNSVLSTDQVPIAAGNIGNFDLTVSATPTNSLLIPTIARSTLPTSVVAGSGVKGKVTVDVDNSANAISSGSTIVTIFATTDGVIDETAVQIGTLTKPKLRIRAGKTTPFVVTIPPLSANLDGSYTLLAQVTDPAGLTSVSATGTSLTAAAPFIAFSETSAVVNLAPAVVDGSRTHATIKFKVTNNGNIKSTGLSQIELFASTDGTAIDGTEIRSLSKSIVLKPGASKTITLPLQTLPSVTDGDYNIGAQITDPDGNITQTATLTQYTLAAPFVSLVPYQGTIVAHASGKATVSYTIINQGNIIPVGKSTANYYASPDGTTADGTIFGTQSATEHLRPGVPKLFHLTLTAAEYDQVLAAGTLVVEIVDPYGGSQTLEISA